MDPWLFGPHAPGDLASCDIRTGHPSNDIKKPYDKMLVESSKDLTDICPPFVGLHKIMELEVFKRIALSDTPFGPLINVDKRWVGIDPRTPLLGESLEVEASSPISELPRTIADRLEGNDVGVVDSRHSD